MAGNWEVAPPPKTVDGLLAVPVDISSITASIVFDGTSASASADATLTYTVGPTAGNPFFDLRQSVSQAWLDGTPFPAAKLAHHAFGTGPFTDLRVIEASQSAGSVHTLRVRYPLAVPDSQLGGSYLPRIEWAPGPRLTFALALSDLNRARYLEAWLPANLQFDQYSIDLDIRIDNTAVPHSVITNGSVTELAARHWTVAFPARFSSVSPLLEIRASDTVERTTGTVMLPVSGKTVTIEVWRPAGSAVDPTAQIAAIRTLLVDNEIGYGGYLHDDRYVAYFTGSGGMEYEGGTTTSAGALLHETFHSWFARGLKPADQSDGWWDEGFTTFHDDGANDAVPLDFTAPPVALCSRDPWQRHTPTASYVSGSALFKGLAAMTGAGPLNTHMRSLYESQAGGLPLSTERLEEHLVARSGDVRVVHAFHRFVYGLPDPFPAPALWLRDDIADPGADNWAGVFWDSPDLWVRTGDDGGTTHQNPEYGQDNWFHARVRNRAGGGAAAHFVVTFRATGYAGTEFVFPADFFEATAVKAEFDLAPGESRIVKARWPKASVPAPGSHTCVVASVLSRFDDPAAGGHVWQAGNLAQKSLTVVDLAPGEYVVVPVVLTNRLGGEQLVHVRRSDPGLQVAVVHRSAELLKNAGLDPRPLVDDPVRSRAREAAPQFDCGGVAPSAPVAPIARAVLASADLDAVLRRFPDAWQAELPDEPVPLGADPFSPLVVGLKVELPEGWEPGHGHRVDLVQRRADTGRIVGGVAVLLNASTPSGDRDEG
ncbi:hypothetical protein ACH4TV_46560 [Streptomyces sp. NPDC020898]|uniref:hypothetical protein n=1 Tax=Streptomyces sp. NPDC020898 TaxID=3365101 RepID=UPI00379E7904